MLSYPSLMVMTGGVSDISMLTISAEEEEEAEKPSAEIKVFIKHSKMDYKLLMGKDPCKCYALHKSNKYISTEFDIVIPPPKMN